MLTMLTSIIAVILSVILYILPCFLYWKEMDKIYKISRRKVLFIKFLVLAGLIFGFIFTYPTKVMFYPWKSFCFVSIIFVIEVISFCTIIRNNVRGNSFNRLIHIPAITLIIAMIDLIAFAGATINLEYPKIIVDNFNIVEEYVIKEVDSESIRFVDSDGDIEEVLINDKNVQIRFVEKIEDVRLEKELKFRKYQEIYSKDQKTFTEESPYTENYNIYLMLAD